MSKIDKLLKLVEEEERTLRTRINRIITSLRTEGEDFSDRDLESIYRNLPPAFKNKYKNKEMAVARYIEDEQLFDESVNKGVK